MKIKLLLYFLVLLIICAVIVAKCVKPTPSIISDKPVIKIGATQPLTGNLAIFGESVKKGILIAVDELNSNPKNIFRYEAIFEDDALNPATALNNALKLINYDKVNVIITSFPAAAKAVKPIAEKNKVLAIHRTYSKNVIDGKYNFQNLIDNNRMAQAFVNFINENNYSNIAIFGIQNESVIEVLDTIENEIQNKNIKFSKHIVLPSERNLKTVVYNIKAQNPDLIIILSLSPVTDIFSKELVLQNVLPTIIGMEIYNNSPEVSNILDNFYSIGITDGTPEFVQKYGGRTYNAQYAYDNVYIIAQAFESLGLINGQLPSAEQISSQLHKIKEFNGVVGKTVLDNKGQFHSEPALYHIEKAVAKIIK